MKKSRKSTATRGAIYKRLRHRITAFCTLVTGLVLLIAFAVAWQAARRQMRNADESLFLSQCQTVTTYVSSPYAVDTQTVLQFAGQNQLAVAVVDGGTLLTFAPDLQKEALTQLLASAQASAIGQGLYSSAAQSGCFMVQSAGQNWRCFLQGQAMSTTQWRNVLVMQPVTAHSAEALRLLAVYAAAFMLGWATLILMSAILARFAVRPIEQAQTEQIRFLASASHELKTPLAVISTSADLLKQKSQDLAEPCHLIQQQARQMGRLIDDILVLTNSSTGRWTLQLRPVLPEEAAMTAYETFQPVLSRAEQVLTLEMPDAPLPMVLADEQRLQQILAILLDNAHTYAPSGSAVALRVDFQHNQVRFWVIDHGPGIPDSAKQAVFTYFYRQTSENEGTATAKNSAHHYGLGLTVATELANLHHGSLTVQDTPGGGASFCLMLPAKQHT
ncbi:MAG: sensor histidine kinase [Gemmiger sp.]